MPTCFFRRGIFLWLLLSVSMFAACADDSATSVTKQERLDMARDAVDARTKYVTGVLHEWAVKDQFWNDVAVIFEKAYKNPIQTTAEILTLYPARTYAGTGGCGCFGPPDSFPPLPSDYPEALYPMWIRDACAQYHAYIGVFGDYDNKPTGNQMEALGKIIEGIIRTSADFLTRAPDNIKRHAFNKDGEVPDNGLDYEPDTLAWLIFLASDYDSVSGGHLDDFFWKAMSATVKVLKDNLYRFGDGSALTNTPFRPSDDKAELPFNIPINAFCAVGMEKLVSLVKRYGASTNIDIEEVEKLAESLRLGVMNRGMAKPADYDKKVFVFETNAKDGEERKDIFMDDAGLPSLLSLPYLGFCKVDNPHYLATRSFVLSKDNKYYFTSTNEGNDYRGIGSPHTQKFSSYAEWGGKGIWPMALIAEGMTLDNADERTSGERKRLLKMIVETSQFECNVNAFGCDEIQLGTTYPVKGYIRESFEIDYPAMYTRGWFAWVNAFFGEWIDRMVGEENAYTQMKLAGGLENDTNGNLEGGDQSLQD